ncbi:MAG TPA: pyridoxal-dependent decarboxylase [Dongiaceae bacterium]|nr:pyridoxal-dependent decarboxylase [Dongiaceae bacterium]
MTPEEFRREAHRLIDWIADYRAGIEDRPVMAMVRPGDVKALLPESAPEQGEGFDAIFDDIDRVIAPGLSHFQHPSFFGYFPANADLAAVLGDFLGSGLGVIGLSWQSSPALTEIEEVACDWLRQLSGLSGRWKGVIQDTASTSTLVALISAREKRSNYALARGGLQSGGPAMTVYVSAQAHSSVDKAATLAGFGMANVRHIETDGDFAMRPEPLRAAIEQDRAAGLAPCAIVATVGTTATTAVDPLRPIGAIAKESGLWLHVDAAMAGSAMILPECRWMFDGIEAADSMVTNPHKWLGASFDCSVYLVQDPEHLVRVMSTNPSYLQSSVDGRVANLRDWGIPLGRRFRALKLWFLLRSSGAEAIRARLRRDMENARWLADEARKASDWRVLAPAHLQTVCLRHEPPGLSGAALDKHTLAWAEAVNRSGEAYVTPATLDGRWMVRVSIGSMTTGRDHVADLWRLMQRLALDM